MSFECLPGANQSAINSAQCTKFPRCGSVVTSGKLTYSGYLRRRSADIRGNGSDGGDQCVKRHHEVLSKMTAAKVAVGPMLYGLLSK